MRVLWALGVDRSVAWGLSWALHSWHSPLTAHSTLSHCDTALPVPFSAGGRAVLPRSPLPWGTQPPGSMAPGYCVPGYSGIHSGGGGVEGGWEGGEVEDSIRALVAGPNPPTVDTAIFYLPSIHSYFSW